MSPENISKNNHNSGKKISRRDFLKLGGVTGTFATLPILLPFGKIFATNGNGTNRTSNKYATTTKNI